MISPTVLKNRPRRTSPFWVFLTLGVWLFWGAGLSHVLGAVDANSEIFQKSGVPSAGATGTVGKASNASAAPLDLKVEKPVSLWDMVKSLFGALLLIVALIVFCGWGLKLLWRRQGWDQISTAAKPIKVLASTHLAANKQLHLVEGGKRVLIVGTGRDEVASLGEIHEAEEIEMIRQASRTEGVFTDVLRKAWNRQESGKTREEATRLAEEGRAAIGGWVDKLKDLSKKSDSGPSTRGGGE